MIKTFLTVLCLLVSVSLGAQQLPHLLADDTPLEVPSKFEVSGFALGAETVHVWVFPEPFYVAWPVFLGTSSTTGFDFKRSFVTGHFSVTASLAPGRYLLVVYAFNPETQSFDSATSKVITVHACLDTPVGPDPYVVPGGAVQYWSFVACR